MAEYNIFMVIADFSGFYPVTMVICVIDPLRRTVRLAHWQAWRALLVAMRGLVAPRPRRSPPPSGQCLAVKHIAGIETPVAHRHITNLVIIQML